MKKPLSPAAVIGGIVGLLAVISALFFFMSKSDPASQAPNEPPCFDAGAKAQESATTDRGPNAPHPR